MKTCSTCKRDKHASEFTKHSKSKDGLRSYCRECQKEKRKTYTIQNPTKIKEQYEKWNKKYGRSYRLEKKYGWTIEAKEALLKVQSWKCGICTNPINLTNGHLDHDHRTGKVRGVLCQACNKGLGFFKDNEKSLYFAAEYVSRDQQHPLYIEMLSDFPKIYTNREI